MTKYKQNIQTNAELWDNEQYKNNISFILARSGNGDNTSCAGRE